MKEECGIEKEGNVPHLECVGVFVLQHNFVEEFQDKNGKK